MILKKPFDDGFCAICTESYERRHDFADVNILCCAACMGTPCKNVTMCKKYGEDELDTSCPEELKPIWEENPTQAISEDSFKDVSSAAVVEEQRKEATDDAGQTISGDNP